MANTAQDCVCSDAEVVQDDAISTGNNIHVIFVFREIMNFTSIIISNSQKSEPCLCHEQDVMCTPRSMSCYMIQGENPIISSEEQQEDEAGDCEISRCPVQQYSVEDEGDQDSGKPINSSHFLRMVQNHAFRPKRHAEAHVNKIFHGICLCIPRDLSSIH